MPQHLSKEEFFALQNLSKYENIVFHKIFEGSSSVIADKTDYSDKIKNLLNIKCKIEKLI